jgi:hypothetical protein
MKRCNAMAAWWDACFPDVRDDTGDGEWFVIVNGVGTVFRALGFIQSTPLYRI